MAQTLVLSPSKRSLKKRNKRVKITITPEQAAEFKGRIPTGVKDQVLAINQEKKREKRELLRKTSKGAIIQQQRLDAFLTEFLANGGNATEAASKVFNVTSRASAASIGSVYLKKAKVLGRLYMEKEGYTYGKLLSIAAKKAEESRLPDWWDRVYEISGYGSFRSVKDGGGPTTNINILQAEKEIFKKYAMDAEEGDVVEADEEETDGDDDIDPVDLLEEGEEPANDDQL